MSMTTGYGDPIEPQRGAGSGRTGHPGDVPGAVPLPTGRRPLGWDPPRAAGAIVLGSLAMLIVIRRGFRGVTVRIGS